MSIQCIRTVRASDRLNMLANFLATKPDEAFDLAIWNRVSAEAPCGTAACAFGWAATIPQFNREGFSLDSHDGIHEPSPRYVDDGIEEYGWWAIAHYFGISRFEAEHIGHPNYYRLKSQRNADESVKRQAVINRLRTYARLYRKRGQ